jgi:hypothetical protein
MQRVSIKRLLRDAQRVPRAAASATTLSNRDQRVVPHCENHARKSKTLSSTKFYQLL